MRFSKRIYALRDAVAIGESVADIGTDHGYVPMLLVRDRICSRVIMSDISHDSLSKAVETFNNVHINTDEKQFRVGDGLEKINAGEVDTVIIAGLGGHTITGILDDDIVKTKSFKKLILQPRKHSGTLRCWLYKNGYDITNEILAKEGKFICEIIVAIPTCESRVKMPYPEDDIRWAYPETLLKANHEYLNIRLSWKISSIEEQIENLKLSEKEQAGSIKSLQSDYDYLSNLLLLTNN